MNWYYAQGDQRQGPVSDSELDALIAAGTINENTLVWKEGMGNWLPLKEARPAGAASSVPPGWIKCTATGRYFPPEEIVYLDGKPYSADAKAKVLQGVLQTGTFPTSNLERNGPPWENREQLGFFQAIWQTVRGCLTEPSSTFSSMRREGGLGAPLAYFMITGWSGGLVTLAAQYFMQPGRHVATAQNDNPFATMMLSGGVLLIWAVLMPVFLVLSSFVGSGIIHLSLMICQGATQPFETTYRTYCYAYGSAAALQIIPICGAYASGIWALVSICIGLAKAHEISTGRAVLAVLLPTIVCCALVIFAVITIIGVAAAANGAHH